MCDISWLLDKLLCTFQMYFQLSFCPTIKILKYIKFLKISVHLICVSFCPRSLGQNETFTSGRFLWINAAILPEQQFFAVNWLTTICLTYQWWKKRLIMLACVFMTFTLLRCLVLPRITLCVIYFIVSLFKLLQYIDNSCVPVRATLFKKRYLY